jgi:subfamily B ATP-binding cassette protein MsbA
MPNASKSNFVRFLGYVRPYTGYLILAIIGGVIKFTVPLLVPQVTRYLLDEVFLNQALTSQQKLHQLLWVTGGMTAVFLLIFAPGVYIRHLCADKASHLAVFRLRCDLYEKILRMSASFFSRNRSGEIVSRLISDVQLAQNLVGSALTNTWMDASATVVILFFLFRLDVPTSLVALATFPAYLYFFRRFSVRIRQTTIQIQDELAVMAGSMNEKISASQVVRAFAGEKAEGRSFRRQSDQHFSTNMRRILVQSANQAVAGTLTNLAPLVVVAFGGYRVIVGHMTVGELIALTMYLGPLYLPLQRFSELNIVLANALAALDRIFQIMDEKPQVQDRPGAMELGRLEGRVDLEHVHFHYAKGNPVLHDVNLTVYPGQQIALVGHSGSGKSTIASLILRFYDVESGAVRLDGVDVRDIRLASLRKHVAVVLQEPVLFSGTIRENILYGNPEAGDAEVIEAARAANAFDFISAMPAGFETEVGERGSQLSAGQRQRITLARAFLRDPRVLILDEATSALDAESEAAIQEAMKRLVEGRTTLIIAHRLATVMGADRIIVLHDGRIVEQGTHAELLQRPGVYREFHRKQVEALWNRGVHGTDPEPVAPKTLCG